MTKSWRKFELLVAQIENHLAPKGAIVKSPDWIRDKGTGQMRQVDASIRYRDGSVPILITVECRERGKVQDVTWIEQLITKRQKIGAQLTIAVSSSGFTKPAIKTALQYDGIETRRIDKITSDTISSWIEKFTVQKMMYWDTIIKYSIQTDEGESDDIFSFRTDIQAVTKAKPFDSHVLFRSEDNAGLSIRDLLHNLERWQAEGHLGQDLFIGLEGEHDRVDRRITIDFSPGHLHTYTEEGKADVIKVVIDLDTRIKREIVPLLNLYQYSNPSGHEITQIAVGAIEISDNPEDKLQIYVQPSQIKRGGHLSHEAFWDEVDAEDQE